MNYKDQKEILYKFYNFAMDEGTGMIREDDIIAFLASEKHYFSPSEDDRDFCKICGENFRDTDMHITTT